MSGLSFRFGTVGSPISRPKNPGGSIGAIRHMRALGLSALELAWVRSVRISEKKCVEIKEVAAEQDIALSIHAPYFINLNANDEEWPKSRKRLMDAAHFGNLAGATEIIFHPGSYFKRPPEEVVPFAIQRLQGCVDELRADGNMATLRPETMGKSAMLGSLEDTLKMSKAIKGVLPGIDFAHLHARPGDGSMNTYDEWVAVLELYRKRLGKKALRNLSCHLSGIEYGPKGERKHLTMTESDFDLKALFQALADLECGGRILSESPILEEDTALYKKTWMEISGESEDTA
ncbi:MAG: TIM barrel protein [Chloroflexi bacterium]|nr:TIM barrel protein [Chloroflexota bacterium]